MSDETTRDVFFGDGFSTEQRELLLQPIRPHRVSQDGKGFSHVEAYEIIAHLNRVFGFEGWDKAVTNLELVFEEQTTTRQNKPAWNVCYRATVRLTVRTPADSWMVKVAEDASTGEATQPSRADAHDLALKSAVSVALKRAAKDLGDQFGLSLYDHGSMQALVQKVVIY
jgi:recombination DNA repair RAD52 pathway protein